MENNEIFSSTTLTKEMQQQYEHIANLRIGRPRGYTDAEILSAYEKIDALNKEERAFQDSTTKKIAALDGNADTLSPAEVAAILKKLDENKDGKISHKELEKLPSLVKEIESGTQQLTPLETPPTTKDIASAKPRSFTI